MNKQEYTKELYGIFDTCRKQLDEKLSEVIKWNGIIVIDEDKLVEEQEDLLSLPLVPITIIRTNGNLMVEYRNSQEVNDFGLLNAEVYDSYLEDLSLDEIYFIINCIKDYQKEK